MNVSYQGLVKVFEALKEGGVPREEASDALELDSDQDVEPTLVEQAINQVYGGTK